MTIKIKLIFLGVLATFSLLFVSVTGTMALNDTAELKHIEIQIAQVSEDMLTLRRREKDFLMRLDLKYRDRFAADYEAMQTQIQAVEVALQAYELDIAVLQQAEQLLQQYNEIFLSLVATQEKIGFHPKDGLYGSLRAAVHAVESPLKDLQADSLTKDMLMLRRREKDFMLREDMKYVDRFNKDFVVMSNNLAASSLPTAQKDSLQALLDKYQKDFLSLVEGFKKRGLNPKDGLRGQMRSAVHDAETQIQTIKTDLIATVEATIESKRNTAFLVTGFFILIIAATIAYIVRGILKPISHMKKAIKVASDNKDLGVKINLQGDDELTEIARAYNVMTEEFQEIIKRVIQSSSLLSQSAEDLAMLTTQTRNGMEQQQQESQQASVAMNEMMTTVQEVSNHAEEAAEASRTADTEANQGRVVVNQAVKGIQQLVADVEQTSDAIQSLSSESENIDTVLNVIQGIAEQTNLLALNAAIEAARAGESGRGFSVVADEVRTLAQRSQEATEEIKTIIERLQSGAKVAVVAMNKGLEHTAENAQQVEAAGRSLDTIADSVGLITNMNNQIAVAATEQTSVTELVNQGMLTIAKVSEQTASATENLTQTSNYLAQLSSDLNGLISQFKVDTHEIQ